MPILGNGLIKHGGASTPVSITATSGTPQSANCGAPFAPLVATITPPLSGVSVTFTAPGSGASGTFASTGTATEMVLTVAGVATSSAFTANGTGGAAYNVTATAGALSCTFTLTNIVVYLFRDTYATNEASPLASPRTAEPTGHWTITQTQGTIAIVKNRLEMTGNNAADVTRLVSQETFARASGLGVFIKRVSGASNSQFAYSYTGAWDNGHILKFSGPVQNSATDTTAVMPTNADIYGIVIRSSGVFYVYKIGPNWFLRYLHNTPTTTPGYIMINHYQNTKTILDNCAVTALPSPWYSDYGVATQRLAGARSAGDIFIHTANCVLDWTVTTLPSASSIEILIRKQDATNYWSVQVDSTGLLSLIEMVDGTPTTRGTSAAAVANGKHLLLYVNAATIIIYVNDKSKISYTSAANFVTSTAGVINSLGTGGAVSDLVSWPFELTGASATVLESACPWTLTTLLLAEKIGLPTVTNPVIPRGTGDSDSGGIRENGNILYEPTDAGREYKTFYTGYQGAYGTDEKIHYAYSSDGLIWTKSSVNPVISDRRAEDPYVVKSGSTYYLYAEDKQSGASRIRRWHSSDCETWVDDGQISGTVTDCASPLVWIESTTWYLIYEDMTAAGTINLATSADGLSWTDEATNPIFTLADTTWATNLDMVPDDIIKIGSIYYMTYHNYDGGNSRSGIASSTDLITWTDSINSPIDTLITTINGGYVATAMIYSIGSQITLLYYLRDIDGIYMGYPLVLL